MLKIKESYDVIVIGSGPSGSACALRCAQLGLKTLCIDNLANDQTKKLEPGVFSNCLTLETLALLESAKLYVSVIHDLSSHGIYSDKVSLDASQMVARKNNILGIVNRNFAQDFSKHKIDFIHAKAKVLNSQSVELSPPISKKITQISAQHIVLASESVPIPIPYVPVDNEFIFDSTAALNINDVPKRLAILGAGVIGLELASIWNRLGSETILLDAQETFLGLTDHQISREAYKIFTEQGLELCLGTRVISTKISNKKVLVEYQDSDGTHAIRVDKLIVASGRKPNSDNLAAPEANLLLNENGYVHVNEKYRTNLPNVYAIGDLTLLGPMLAQKGIAEGIFVAEQIAGTPILAIDYDIMPNVIHTEPEIAWVGQTEQAIKSMGDSIKIGLFPLNMNPKAIATDKANGIIKIISCANTDKILGVHIIGSNASELIAEATLAMEFSASCEDITNTVHPYPSVVDSIREASQAIIIKTEKP
jgi:dihydrolipoamide dehydrogenase